MIASVELYHPIVSLIVGQTYSLVAKSYQADHNLEAETYTWGSGTPGVATVSNAGLVTAIGLGDAVITVTGGTSGLQKTTTIHVMPTPNWSSAGRASRRAYA